MEISIVIPTLNEESFISRTLTKIINRSGSGVKEIIVVDGGSTDATVSCAESFAGVQVITCPKRGRASQMNAGAAVARGDVLYFLHADSIPPHNFDKKITARVKKGAKAGCFRLAFDYDHPLLKFYGWCTRFNINAFRFGDQSLFITKELFRKIGGYREDHYLMEDNEIVIRIKKEHSFTIMSQSVTTSSRKYQRNGVLKLELIFMLIYFSYHLGLSQKNLKKLFNKLIN